MIERPQVGARVTGRRKGVGTVVGPSIPMSRFYVSVTWDNSGRTENALIEDLCLYEPKLTVSEEKVEHFRRQPELYRLAGRLLRSELVIEVSSSPRYFEKVVDVLEENHIEYEVGRTLTVSRREDTGHTVSWWLCARDSGWLELARKYFPNAHERKCHWGFITSKPFVLHFLLIELRFSLGNRHDLSRIIDQVPSLFQSSFEEGLFG